MRLQNKFWRAAFSAAALGMLAAGFIQAQEFRGTISGAVSDPTGAVVPGAAVTVKEIQTGTVNKTKSDAAGQYVVPFLAPGEYQITANATGFQTVVRSNITLQSQEHPIINLILPVGATDTTVEVTTAAPLVDQANASVGQIISTESVADLPLNGRTPTSLTELSVGVITTSPPGIVHPFDNNAGNSWSIGGTPNQVSEVLLDGSPDLTLLGALAYAPTQDSVQEVSVRPFDTDASFGHTIGGVINQITKSGTNHLHGTIYEFNQIPNLDANLYLNGRTGGKTPTFHYNQYGLTVGGPILIPKLFNGKDKLFFFFAYEGLKDNTPASTVTTVPTAAERAGDFSQTLAAGCPNGFANNPATAAAMCNGDTSNSKVHLDPNQLYNPFTATMSGTNIARTPIFNNQLPSTGHAFDPVALNVLSLFPAPNTTVGVATDGQGNYTSSAPAIDTYSNEFGRIDYNISARDHVFFDIRHNIRSNHSRDYFGNGATGVTLTRENYGATLDNVLTISPTTILDTRVNFTFFNEFHGTPAQKYSPTSIGQPGGLTSASEEVQLPYLNFNTGGSCGSFTSYQCLGDNSSALDPTTSYQAFIDVVKIIGKHTLKIGFDGRQYRLSVQNLSYSAGEYTFNSSFVTAGTGAASQTFGGDFADFLFGLPSAGEYDQPARADYRSYYIGSFLQDDWRVSPKLTLNLGIRYDVNTPFGERLGHTENGFNPTAVNSASAAASAAFTAKPNALVASTTGLNTLGGLTFPSGPGGAPFQVNGNFVSPRIGFSYSVDPKTVIRGGFGTFVQPQGLSNLASTGVTSSNAISNQPGFSATTTYTSSTNNGLTPPTNTLSNPFPNGLNPAAGSSLGASTYLGQSFNFFAPYEKNPYSERFDLGFQRELTSSTLFELLYVGNHSLHLPVGQQNINTIRTPYLSTTPYRNQNIALAYGATVANPFAGLLPNGGSANSATVSESNLLYAYPQYGTSAIYEQNETIGQSYFHSGIVHIEQRARHGLTLTANYSFSKLTEADTYLNDEDTTLTHRISPFDHTHHFTVGGTYNLPFGKDKLFSFGGSRLANEIFGGFVINSIYQFQTGQPFLFSADIPLRAGYTPRDIHINARNTSVPASGNPALSTGVFETGNATLTAAQCTTTVCDGSVDIGGQYYDHYRTLPQTISSVRQDGFNNLDASILKNFSFTEKTYLQLRFETFNTLNRATFSAPNVSSATSSNFGYITAVPSTSQPRQVQLGARIVF